MQKRADLSIQLIVIAAIALLVLIILAVMFTGKFKAFGTGIDRCSSRNGVCESACESNEATFSGTDCAQVCCVDLRDSVDDNDT